MSYGITRISLSKLWKSILIPGCALSLVVAQPDVARTGTNPDRTESNYHLQLTGGYFTPARGTMRNLYGGAINVSGSFERRLTDKLWLGIYGGYLEQDKGDLSLKYRNRYVGSTITRTIAEGRRLRLYGQAGAGLNFREVFYVVWLYEQRDFGLSAMAAVGADYLLAGPVLVGAKVNFDYMFDGDPTTGSFGNTGGLNFQLTGGLVF